MIRTERIVREEEILREIDVYNELIVPHPIEKYSTGRGFASKGTIDSLVNRAHTRFILS